MKEENQENCPLVHHENHHQDQNNNNNNNTDTIISTSTTTNNNNNVININNNNVNISYNKEQDRLLPIANVGRIMKKKIPTNGKISKDAKETVQECVSEFISFVTGEASDKCQREKRKTINGDDIIWAITTLGFEDYVGPLKLYLNKYREIEGEKLNVPKQVQDQRSLVDQIRPHQHHHHHHPHHDHQQNSLNHNTTTINVPNFNALCSSANLLAAPHQPSFLPTHDHHHQPFSLPAFSPNSIQFQQQDHIDNSVGHW